MQSIQVVPETVLCLYDQSSASSTVCKRCSSSFKDVHDMKMGGQDVTLSGRCDQTKSANAWP